MRRGGGGGGVPRQENEKKQLGRGNPRRLPGRLGAQYGATAATRGISEAILWTNGEPVEGSGARCVWQLLVLSQLNNSFS